MAALAPQGHGPLQSYHDMGSMVPQRAVVFLDHIEPAVALQTNLPAMLGDPRADANNIHIRAKFNTNRLGLPGIDIIFIIPGSNPNTNIAQTTLSFEPGVAAASSTGTEARYNLQVVDGRFLGTPGGGGHTYDHDPNIIANLPVQERKRVLRVEIIAHGAVCYPDTLSTSRFLTHPQLPPQVRHLIRSILDASVIGMRLYCSFNTPQDQIMAEIVQPLMTTVLERRPPLSQYNPPGRMLMLDMASYSTFQGSMYCNRLSKSPPVFAQASHLLPDAQSRPTHRLITITHTIGLIREYQGLERISSQFCNGHQRMRLVRSRHPVFAAPTSAVLQSDHGIAIPNDQHMYLGYINDAVPFNRDIAIPPPGTRYTVSFGAGIEPAFGMVLDIPNSTLQSSNAAFVLALFKVPATIKSGNAAASLATSTARNVQLTYIRNQGVAMARLASLARFSGVTRDRGVNTLQRYSTYRRRQARVLTHDVRVDAMNWNNALVQTRAHALQGAALSQGSNNLLTTVVRSMDGNVQMVETAVDGPNFRACVALAFQFLAMDRRVVFISDFARHRAVMASQIWRMREFTRQAPTFGPKWGNSRLLAFTSSIIAQDEDYADRDKADLATRYLDDLPRHEWLTDETDAHGQSSNATPAGDIPVEMSMGAAIGGYLSATNTSIQLRRQYYQDRRQDIDNTRASVADVRSILRRRNEAEEQVLRQTDLLVTNSSTAIAESVTRSMQGAVLIFTDVHAMQWYTLASTVARYPCSHAIFLCGDLADITSRLRFSARGENEAWNSIQYSAWEVLLRAGNVAHSLA